MTPNDLRAWAAAHPSLQAQDVVRFADWTEEVERLERLRRSPAIAVALGSQDAAIASQARATAQAIIECLAALEATRP